MMKRFTLMAAALLLCGFSMNAQSDCNNAEAITVAADASVTVNSTGVTGTAATQTCNPTFYTTAEITASAWYTYTNTGTQSLMVTVTGAVPADLTNGYIPSFSVLSGSCGSLTCEGGDIITQDQTTGQLFDAVVQFVAQAGVTYYIVFDDYYSATPGLGTTAAFDFVVATDSNIPSAPGNVTNVSPTDGATNVDINEADGNGDGNPDNSVAISWTPSTDGVNVDGFQIYLGTTAPTTYTDLNLLGTAQPTSTSINITGMDYNTTYYWAVVPINGAIPADEAGVQMWSFTTEATAGVEDSQLVNVSLYPNPVVDVLNITLPSSVELKSAAMHDLLGKQTQVSVSENNTIDMSQMAAGVYILKLETNQGVMTQKVIKQ